MVVYFYAIAYLALPLKRLGKVSVCMPWLKVLCFQELLLSFDYSPLIYSLNVCRS